MSFQTTRSVDPTVEPLSLATVKEHLRIRNDDDDADLRRRITSARVWAENFLRRALITQTWKLYMSGFRATVIHLPNPPLQSVTTVEYVDTAGDTQTLSASLYDVDTDAEMGRIYPAFGESWPTARQHPKSVTITYVAGYGATAETVPDDIRSAMLLQVARRYEDREPFVVGSIHKDTEADSMLLRPYQIAVF